MLRMLTQANYCDWLLPWLRYRHAAAVAVITAMVAAMTGEVMSRKA